MTTFTMQAPTPAFTRISARDGSVYFSDAAGLVANVDIGDAFDLIQAGWQIVGPGFGNFSLNLLGGKNSDGSALAAAASSGKFGSTITLGTSICLISEVANNNAKTDTILFDVQMPNSFPAGKPPIIIVNQNHVIGSATLSVHTLAAHLYPTANDGTQLADVVATAAQNTSAAAADLTFLCTGASFQPNQRAILSLVMALTETSTHNANGQINSVRFSV